MLMGPLPACSGGDLGTVRSSHSGRSRLCGVDVTLPMKAWEGLRRCQPVFMGMAKAVYVRNEETELWERAERYAKARRLTMSALVLTALEAYLADDDG